EASPPLPREQLRLLGHLSAIQGRRAMAEEAYALVGEPIPAESLVVCGCWHLCEERWRDALAAFTDARGPHDKLLLSITRYADSILAGVRNAAVDSDLLLRAFQILNGEKHRMLGLAQRSCETGLPEVAQRL